MMKTYIDASRNSSVKKYRRFAMHVQYSTKSTVCCFFASPQKSTGRFRNSFSNHDLMLAASP